MAGPVTKARAETLVDAIRTAEGTDAQREAAAALRGVVLLCAMPWTSRLPDAGIAPALTTALREWDDVEAKESCIFVITSLCNGLLSDYKQMQTVFAEAGVLEPMVSFLPHTDSLGGSVAAWGLYTLTYNNPEVTQQLRDVPGVMEALKVVTDSEKSPYSKLVLDSLRSLSPSGWTVKPARA